MVTHSPFLANLSRRCFLRSASLSATAALVTASCSKQPSITLGQSQSRTLQISHFITLNIL